MANYILLERITVGAAGASSVTFNNIPQTGYTDLKLVMSARTNSSNITDQACIQFGTSGGISTSGYSDKTLYVSGGSALSFSNSGTFTYETRINGGATTSNSFSNVESYIPNYTSSNYKSMSNDGVAENNATASGLWLGASLWSNTGAITSIKIYPDGGSFVQYCTFSLYALAAVGTTPTKAPKAIGGDIIQTDGTYWYHAFLSSGSFTPQTALSCDVLVVAGGGGGGSSPSGSTNGSAGGGAGGVLAFASQALTANTTNLVTVGAGGTVTAGTSGSSGGNSSFGSITPASVGGGGGAYSTVGGSGGSGGGGSGSNAGGSPTTNQGFAGGSGDASQGGGGGGAGGVGGNASNGSNYGGAGGAGVTTYTNWSGGLSSALTTLGLGVSNYIAGGGGGGAYASGTGGSAGSGGGGAGGASATSAVANTGSGGGGSNGNSGGATGGKGGSGLVIVRYAY